MLSLFSEVYDVAQLPDRDASEKIFQHVQSYADDNGGEYIAFSGVSKRVFEIFCIRRELERSNGRVTYFGADSGILLVKMPARAHEVAHATAIDDLRDQAVAMGLKRKIYRVGVSQYDSIDNNGAAKQPDDGLAPSDYRFADGDFPTFVMEAANTRSLQCIRAAKD